MKKLKKYLTAGAGGTGEPIIDNRVESLSCSLPDTIIAWAWNEVDSWQPIFTDNHVERVEKLLAHLELLGDILVNTKSVEVASLRGDFSNSLAWDSIVGANLVNCWTDDSGVEYVEVGRQV